MPSLDVIRQLTIKAAAQGVDQAASSLNQLDQAQKRVSASAVEMGAVTETSSKRQLSAATQLDRLRRSLDEGYKSQQLYARGQAVLDRANAQGLIDAKSRSELLDLLGRQYGIVGGAVGAATGALVRHAEAHSLSNRQMLESAHIARGLVEAMAAGEISFRNLSIEAFRTAQVLRHGGGLAGTMEELHGTISKLLSPMVLFGTGAVAAASLAVYAFARVEDQAEKMQRALNGVGAGSGFTIGRLSAAADTAASGVKNLSSGGARDIAAQLAATGRIGPEMLPSILGEARQFSVATNQTLAEGGADLARAFSDPAKGAELLQEKLGPLNAATLELIRSQEAAGDRLGAQATLMDAFRGRIESATDASNIFRRVWEGIKQDASDRIDTFGRFLAGPTLEEQLAVVQRRLKAGAEPLDPRAFTGTGGFAISPQVDEQKRKADLAEEARLTEAIAAANVKAAAAKQEAYVAEQSQLGRAAIAGVYPEIAQRQRLIDQRDALGAAIDTFSPSGRRDRDVNPLGVPVDQARAAFDALGNRINALGSAAQKVAQDSALATSALMAETGEDKTVIEAHRSYIEVMRQNGGETLAAAKSLETWNAAIAASNKAASDALYASKDKLALVGLKPGDRQLMEIEQERKLTFLKNVDGSGYAPGASALGGGAATSSSDTVSAYIREAATKRGIDPNVALAVARSEGLNKYVGDNGSSFGPFQLHYGGVAGGGNSVGGLGDVFTRQTGLDARDPSTVKQQIDFALDQAAKGGWGPWHGWTGDPRAGIGGSSGNGLIKSTSESEWNKNYDNLRTAAIKGQEVGPINAATEALKAENDALTAQIASFGKSKAAIAEVTERQKLLTEYEANNSRPISDDLRARVDAVAKSYGDYAKRLDDAQKAQKQLVGEMDAVRNITGNGLSTFINDLEQGKRFADAFKDSLKSMANVATQKLESGLMDALLGKQGTPGGGLLGDSLSSLLKGASGSPGGSAGGGGLFGALSGLFGGSAAAAGGGAAGAVSSLGPGVAGLFHSGGLVGRDGEMRWVDPALWNDAPRLHSGTLASDEYRAILQKGEIVVPRSAAGGQSSSSSNITHAPTYNIDARGAQAGVAEQISAAITAHDAHINATIVPRIAQQMQRRG